MKHRKPKDKDSRWRWSSFWTASWVDRPFHSVTEQRAFDLELARLRAQNNVALTVSKIVYGLR